MAKRQQQSIGVALGLMVLVGLFVAGYAVLTGNGVDDFPTGSNGDGVAADGGPAPAADGAGDDGSETIGAVGQSGADGDVRSFGQNVDGSISSDSASGVALRVVTDEGAGATTSSTPSTAVPSGETSTSEPAPTTASTAPSSSSTSSSSSSSSTSTTVPTTAVTETTAMQTTTAKDTSTAPTTTPTQPPSSEQTTSTRPATTVAPSTDARSFEQEVIRLTNDARAGGGCAPLTHNDKLHAAALGHSVDMADNNYFSHTSQDGSTMTDRIERQGYAWRSLAENIAAGYRTPASVVDGWMNSKGHRDNIMNCNLTEIGVGFHKHYWTQNFGTPR